MKKYNPILTKVGYGFIFYHTIVMALLELINPFSLKSDLMAQLETINWGICVLLIILIVVLSYKNNRYLFKYYLVAYGILLIMLMFLFMHSLNADNWLFFEHGLKAGTLVEIITLSFAVSRRFKITEDDLRHKKEEEQQLNEQISELEMNVRKAQMNPHFMFNALTSIEYFIMKNDAQKAREYLEKFSRLMRLTLDNSRSNYISLTDDLDALTFYIDLEFLRLSTYHHHYEINIDEAIDPDKIVVPALLIQPFVENAIWHGLQKKEKAGHLLIDLRFVGDELRCTIEDDGGGMDQKKVPVKRKSSGIVITKERLTLIHVAQKSNYQFRMEDVKDENGHSVGTSVQFNMPYLKE